MFQIHDARIAPRRASRSLRIGALVLAALACQRVEAPSDGAESPRAIAVEDDAGQLVVLRGAARRVVSLVPSATDILERSEFAVLSARQAERGEIGSIEMGFIPSAAFEFVPRIVAALAVRLPGVSFNPIEMMSYEIVEALRAGRLDFGLTRSRGPAGPIQAARVINEPFVLALPADGALAALAEPTLADLDGADFIGYSTERGGYLRTVHEGLFATAGITPRVVLEVSQTHTVLALVDRGLGAALVPASASMVHMANLTYRRIRIPARFRSTIYLSSGARGAGALHDRVRDVIRAALADLEGATRE